MFVERKKEPELLRVDAERIQRQMQEVAVGNYRAFISAADALVAIKEEVSSIDKHLESLVINFIIIKIFIFLPFLCCVTCYLLSNTEISFDLWSIMN